MNCTKASCPSLSCLLWFDVVLCYAASTLLSQSAEKTFFTPSKYRHCKQTKHQLVCLEDVTSAFVYISVTASHHRASQEDTFEKG